MRTGQWLVALCSTAAFGVTAGACSASSGQDAALADGAASEAGIDGALDAAPLDARPPANNPYGKPYPTEHLGERVRLGLVPGDVLRNLSFTGYPPGITSASFVQMATFYDPEGRTHDLVAILMVNVWDSHSREAMAALAPPQLPDRVALISVLGEADAPQKPAALADLTEWRTRASVGVWHVLDPRFAQFPEAVGVKQASPSMILLDARTMEIVRDEAGAVTADAKKFFEDFAAAVRKRPPSY